MTVPKAIRDMSEGIEDPRCACDVKIPLYDVLAVSIAAILCGQEELSSMMDYIDMHRDELTAQFGLSSIPSESTLRRVLSLINPLQFGIACLGLMQRGGVEPGDVIAVDGKAIRSTEKLKSLQRGLRVLSAYDIATSTVIGQLEVGEKTNEIPVFQSLLPMLTLTGRIVTADAMHCQKRSCALVIEGGGDYVFQVKKNQKELYEYVQTYMDDLLQRGDQDLSTYTQTDIGHGRTEQRTCSIARVDGLPELEEWSGIALFIAMDRTTEQGGRVTEERSYYISSLLGTATHLWHVIRDHWQIESMHWMLDVTFHEDACRAHNATLQLNLNLLRKLALTILRQHLKRQADSGDKKAVRRSLRQQMNRCLAHVSTLVEVLSQADIASLFATELDA